MLVLSRKAGEQIVIADNIKITVNRINGNRVTLGIEAPADVHIMRGELKKIANSFRDADQPETVSIGGAPLADESDPDAGGYSLWAVG